MVNSLAVIGNASVDISLVQRKSCFFEFLVVVGVVKLLIGFFDV